MARVTSLEERVTMIELAQAGYTDRQIAQETGWSVATVRKWRRRWQRLGRCGLSLRMGRPATGAMGTFPLPIRDMLRAWRQKHSRWGAKTLLAELEADDTLAGQGLPSRATISRWLKQEGFTKRYERHQELPQNVSGGAKAAHEEWELDARGYEKVPEVGVVALISVNDRFSRVKLLCYPCLLGEQRASRHPTTADYQLVLRLAFTEWGLPDRIAVDRDSVFYDNSSQSPFPTQLHLWLLALGVSLQVGRAGHPTARAITERGHQTWEAQVLQGQTFSHWQALWLTLQQRRDFLNERLPCSSLGDKPPLVAYPEARQPRRLYRPEYEAQSLNLSRVYAYLGQGRWFRKASNSGAVTLGRHRYALGYSWARQEVEITFDPEQQQLLFRSQDGQKSVQRPIKGLSPTDLMGEMAAFAALDHFQLALPFSPGEWRMIRLSEILSDTS